jgi:hypothetical protein
MVTICEELVAPTPTGPKSSTSGVTQRRAEEGGSPVEPVPARWIVKRPAFVDELEVAVKAPTASGVKLKMYWQLAPGATPPVQFWDPWNLGSEGAPPEKLARVDMPVFRMVTTCDELVTPGCTGPKSRESGLTLIPAPTPVPRSEIVNGPALVVVLEVALNAPTPAGEKEKVYWQLAPGATPPAQFWNPLN